MSLQRALSRRTDRRHAALGRLRRHCASVVPLELMLADPQLAPAVRRWLDRAAATGGRTCECVHCHAPWTRPAAVVVVDPLDAAGQGLAGGLCASCAAPEGLQSRVVQALARDVGLDAKGWQRVAAAGLA